MHGIHLVVKMILFTNANDKTHWGRMGEKRRAILYQFYRQQHQMIKKNPNIFLWPSLDYTDLYVYLKKKKSIITTLPLFDLE